MVLRSCSLEALIRGSEEGGGDVEWNGMDFRAG
jgi:hypothetical protein